MTARLIPLGAGSPVDLSVPIVLLGRSAECDVRFEDASVSDLHCVIVSADGVLLLRDLGSANGTHVDGKQCRRAILLPGAELRIGELPFRVECSLVDEMGVENERLT